MWIDRVYSCQLPVVSINMNKTITTYYFLKCQIYDCMFYLLSVHNDTDRKYNYFYKRSICQVGVNLMFLRSEQNYSQYQYSSISLHVHVKKWGCPAWKTFLGWKLHLCNSSKSHVGCLSFFFLGLTICGSWILKAVLKRKILDHINTSKDKTASHCITSDVYQYNSEEILIPSKICDSRCFNKKNNNKRKKTYSQVVQMGLKLQNT